jgi:hypothetical protein
MLVFRTFAPLSSHLILVIASFKSLTVVTYWRVVIPFLFSHLQVRRRRGVRLEKSITFGQANNRATEYLGRSRRLWSGKRRNRGKAVYYYYTFVICFPFVRHNHNHTKQNKTKMPQLKCGSLLSKHISPTIHYIRHSPCVSMLS